MMKFTAVEVATVLTISFLTFIGLVTIAALIFR